MADTDPRSPGDDDWSKEKGAGRFFRDVVIVAVVLAGGFGFYYYRTQNASMANKTAKEAKDLLVLDNPKDYVAAEAKLQEVLAKYDSSHAYSLAALGELNALLWGDHKLADRKAKAEEFAKKAMDENPGIAEQYSARALVDLYNGKASEVEGWLKRDVLDKGAGAGRVFDAYGRSLRAQGKLEEARRAFKGAHDADWRNPRFAADIAESYLEDGDTINALTYYNKGIQSNADHLVCKLGWSRTRILRGEGLKEASDVLADVLGRPDSEVTPNIKARALVARAELRLFEQKPADAVADADAAVAADPGYAPAYAAKGLALARQKDAGAAAAFEKAISTDPYVASFYYDAAHSLIDAGVATDKALAYLEKFPLPKDDRYHVKYGDALRKLGKLDESIVAYDAAIKENGLNAPAHFSKSLALWAKKDAENALKEVDMALGAQEIFPDAQIHKGDMLFEAKKYQDALQEYFAALNHLRLLKAPRERLTGMVEKIKGDLLKAKEKDLAKVWETEAGAAIK